MKGQAQYRSSARLVEYPPDFSLVGPEANLPVRVTGGDAFAVRARGESEYGAAGTSLPKDEGDSRFSFPRFFFTGLFSVRLFCVRRLDLQYNEISVSGADRQAIGFRLKGESGRGPVA